MSKKKKKVFLNEKENGFKYFYDLFSEVDLQKEKLITDKNKKNLRFIHKFIFTKFRVEKKNRGGKTVTVLYDFQYEGNLKNIVKTIKKDLGIGGSIINNTLEFSGDMRIRLAEYLKINFNTKIKGY